jgi:hypothetical protein
MCGPRISRCIPEIKLVTETNAFGLKTYKGLLSNSAPGGVKNIDILSALLIVVEPGWTNYN